MKIMEIYEYIDKIIEEISNAVDTRGLSRSLAQVKIAQMLWTLKDGVKQQEEAHKAEKDLLQKQIDDLLRQMTGGAPLEKVDIDLDPRHTQEENQNGRIDIEPALVCSDSLPADD